MTWKKYHIAGHVYPTIHAASINLKINEKTLDRIKMYSDNEDTEKELVSVIQNGHQMYGEPFKVKGKWFVSMTHFADALSLKRSTLEYKISNGSKLEEIEHQVFNKIDINKKP